MIYTINRYNNFSEGVVDNIKTDIKNTKDLKDQWKMLISLINIFG